MPFPSWSSPATLLSTLKYMPGFRF